jgi:ribonuclease HII
MLSANHSGFYPEAGCDEAGRGCLAGPVVGAAVILPDTFNVPILNDSKQLSEKVREDLRGIIEREAIAWSVVFADNTEIDRTNILRASIATMQRALLQLSTRPAFAVIDGNRFYTIPGIHHTCVVKGDAKILSIAAASVLAKTHRDEFMREAHQQYPQYGWADNKGYPTLAHRAAIEEFGVTPLHRLSFQLLKIENKGQKKLQL